MRLAADCAVPRARRISCVPRLHWVFQALITRHPLPGLAHHRLIRPGCVSQVALHGHFGSPCCVPSFQPQSVTVTMVISLIAFHWVYLVLHLATKTLQPKSTPQRHGPLSPPPTLTSLSLAEVKTHISQSWAMLSGSNSRGDGLDHCFSPSRYGIGG